MQEKHKDLLLGAGLAGTEIVWTGFLCWVTSKIPYVGIPIATVIGIMGVLSANYFFNVSRCHKDKNYINVV